MVLIAKKIKNRTRLKLSHRATPLGPPIGALPNSTPSPASFSSWRGHFFSAPLNHGLITICKSCSSCTHHFSILFLHTIFQPRRAPISDFCWSSFPKCLLQPSAFSTRVLPCSAKCHAACLSPPLPTTPSTHADCLPIIVLRAPRPACVAPEHRGLRSS